MVVMATSIEKILADAKQLVGRLREHDSIADSLITQSQALNRRVDAMKQYEEDLNELNEMARHKPRAALVLGIAQENRQIRELQQENKELRMSLEEHQSALELIMSKYREQILKLLMANKLDMSVVSKDSTVEVLNKIDKITEMAAVMQKAVQIDDRLVTEDQEKLTRLQLENKGLRELLDITRSMGTKPKLDDAACQTIDVFSDDDDASSSASSVVSVVTKMPTPPPSDLNIHMTGLSIEDTVMADSEHDESITPTDDSPNYSTIKRRPHTDAKAS